MAYEDPLLHGEQPFFPSTSWMLDIAAITGSAVRTAPWQIEEKIWYDAQMTSIIYFMLQALKEIWK